MMILQGDADTQVHYSQAELLYEALEKTVFAMSTISFTVRSMRMHTSFRKK